MDYLQLPTELTQTGEIRLRHIGQVMSDVLSRHGLSESTFEVFTKEAVVDLREWPAVGFGPVELCTV